MPPIHLVITTLTRLVTNDFQVTNQIMSQKPLSIINSKNTDTNMEITSPNSKNYGRASMTAAVRLAANFENGRPDVSIIPECESKKRPQRISCQTVIGTIMAIVSTICGLLALKDIKFCICRNNVCSNCEYENLDLGKIQRDRRW